MYNTKLKLRNMTAIYISRDEKMLMLYRIGSRVVQPSWCGIGGHFENEELNDPQSCVLRELREEAGIVENNLRNIRLRYVTFRLKNQEIRQNYYYFAELADDVQPVMISEEGRLAWIPFSDILKKEMPLTAKQMMTHYMKTGRFTDQLYAGTTGEEKMIISPLKDF